IEIRILVVTGAVEADHIRDYLIQDRRIATKATMAAESEIVFPLSDQAVQGFGVNATQIDLDAGIIEMLFDQLSLALGIRCSQELYSIRIAIDRIILSFSVHCVTQLLQQLSCPGGIMSILFLARVMPIVVGGIKSRASLQA